MRAGEFAVRVGGEDGRIVYEGDSRLLANGIFAGIVDSNIEACIRQRTELISGEMTLRSWPDTGADIDKWLRDHPEEAHILAYKAITGLYFDDKGQLNLADESFPSGADYIDHIVTEMFDLDESGTLKKLLSGI
jgi:hypothetical protein